MEGTAIGTVSNLKGRYSLKFESRDSVTVIFSMLGYQTRKRKLVRPQGNISLNITLPPMNFELGEVSVTERRRQTGTIQQIETKQNRPAPDASGGSIEAVIATQAGVSSNNELSSQYNVRGGSFDENMVYVNGIEIYRPLLIRSGQQEGLSFINPDMVQSVGFSGITANPLLGMFSDFLIAQGGTSVLTEVPEMFGAETILMNRCSDEGLFEQTVHLINDFKEYFLSHGEPVGENPSPGNKAGGISTLEEKALGCTQKCGKSYVSGVMPYGERLQKKGLNLLSAPGNDLVAATTLAACGCHMVLFTTGRGTPFGTFVPTMKISTNSNLAKNKPGWIDFNAGVIVENEPMEKTCERFIDYVIKVASGEFVNNEKKGYREIAIFKTGVTL